jgi:hypothetical protein
MAVLPTGYIASTIPAKQVHVSGTTLFHVALHHMGDALHWPEIAALNGLTDPWVTGLTTLLIPPVPATGPLTGILE